ncbi:hypothetical protein GT348_05595 [Aristophania vespae]|uniref:Uncharacterized protein n=1 Tax=Aristophania vespae TaxID=2697033 RepID=A0A6P1NE54_9PROT|nr:hypothetical protein [Aristophania vespae]QHI95789.1 hypothetical protein GT348_05595 [Aristophania vespae]UMM63494.1 hypothetical protein DM15PD_04680 [Aristophania vespae]
MDIVEYPQHNEFVHNDDPIERLETALVRVGFILEQRDSQALSYQKEKETFMSSLTERIEDLEHKIKSLLEVPVKDEQKEG